MYPGRRWLALAIASCGDRGGVGVGRVPARGRSGRSRAIDEQFITPRQGVAIGGYGGTLRERARQSTTTSARLALGRGNTALGVQFRLGDVPRGREDRFERPEVPTNRTR